MSRFEKREALGKSEFGSDWRRSGEPAGLSEHHFIEAIEDRLLRLVRRGGRR